MRCVAQVSATAAWVVMANISPIFISVSSYPSLVVLTFLHLSDPVMHTLYHPNIRSPSPLPQPQNNPFELLFRSSANTNSTTSASTQSSPEQYGLLTRRLQEERSATEDVRRVDSSKTHLRRKGNPKLLLMGQRRYEKPSSPSAATLTKTQIRQIIDPECHLPEDAACRDVVPRSNEHDQAGFHAVCISYPAVPPPYQLTASADRSPTSR